jgi:N-terminal half of MaoC dehydratase
LRAPTAGGVIPVNRELEGKEYEEIALAVDRDRVVGFAEAIGDPDPRYREGEAPIAPPTFPTVLQLFGSAQVVADSDLGLDYSRVVHGGQEFEWRRPIRVGDRLAAHPRIERIAAKGGNEFLTVETEIRDTAGDLVAVARSTLISRGTAT